MTTAWTYRYAHRLDSMSSSIIREILKLSSQPGVISFAGGLPAPELFPLQAFDEAMSRVLQKYGSKALQYSTTEGFLPLRELIVEWTAQQGVNISVDNVLLTSGSQQALDILGRVLLNAGDVVLTEEPTYLGALQAWKAYQAKFTSVPIDEQGVRTDLLEEALRAGPKLLYILPNFQNPGGTTLALERRTALIEIAQRYGIPIVEDDPYGALRFEGEDLPSLLALDARAGNGRSPNGSPLTSLVDGNVIYLSTFSKTLAPGLRLGWIIAPTDVIKKCVMAKQGIDLHTSTLIQMLAYEVAKDGFITQHVDKIRDVYRQRRDLMIAEMAAHFPADVSWTRPDGGLFLFVTLPKGADAKEILAMAVDNKVAFVPGEPFYPHGAGQNSFRLNFSNATEEQIVEGIARLGQVLHKALDSLRQLESA